MKRGFRGIPRPLLPAMLSVVDPNAGQEVPYVTQPQPSSTVVPPTPPTTQPIPFETTTIPPLSQPAPPPPIAETTTAYPSPSPSPAHEPMEHTFEQPPTDKQPPTPRQEATTSQLMLRIGDLEKQLKETKQTFGKAILTLVDRIKTLEAALKGKTKRVILSDSEEEETEARGRKTHDLDPLVSLVQELVTPSKIVNALGEEQIKYISPTTLEAAVILTKVQKIKSVDKGKRYKRRKSSKVFAGTGLNFEEVKSAPEEVKTGGIRVSSGIEEVNAGSLDVNIGIDPVTTDSKRVSVLSPDRGRREGKASMTEEEETQASKRTKEQILQEEAGLAEAIRLDALEKALKKEEVAKQRKLEANARMKKSVLGKESYVDKICKYGWYQTNQRRRLKKTKMISQPEDGKRSKTIEGKDSIQTMIRMKLKIQVKLMKKIILLQEGKVVYQIVRGDGLIWLYISFGAMLTDISRDALKSYYRVYCLNLESVDIYMLIERKYPLSTEVCKAILDKKLQGGKPDEDCYKVLKMMEKQAGIRKHKDWLVQEQMALGKDFSNLLMANNLPKIVWLSTHHIVWKKVNTLYQMMWDTTYWGFLGVRTAIDLLESSSTASRYGVLSLQDTTYWVFNPSWLFAKCRYGYAVSS
ncbi:hypothetical protein Tco_0969160 [Tanacetum coccineum]